MAQFYYTLRVTSGGLVGAVFIAGLIAFVWFCFAFMAKRQRRWKEAARALAGELASEVDARSVHDWTSDKDVFEWSEPGLKLGLSGGSTAVDIPGGPGPVPIAQGVFWARFEREPAATDEELAAKAQALRSSIRNVEASREGLVVHCFDFADFKPAVGATLELARSLAGRS
jgi:hypothetical protein